MYVLYSGLFCSFNRRWKLPLFSVEVVYVNLDEISFLYAYILPRFFIEHNKWQRSIKISGIKSAFKFFLFLFGMDSSRNSLDSYLISKFSDLVTTQWGSELIGETWSVATALKKSQYVLKFHGHFPGYRASWKEICKHSWLCQIGRVLV